MIVRRVTDDVLVAAFDDEEVPVLDACDELHALAAFLLVDGLCKVLVEVIDEDCRILSLQIPTVVSDNLSVLQGDDVTANGHVVVGHFIAYAGSLQRSAAFIDLIKVVAKNGGVGNLRTRGKPLRYCNEASAASFACQPVHHGLVSILQQRLTAQSLYSVVGHSVT